MPIIPLSSLKTGIKSIAKQAIQRSQQNRIQSFLDGLNPNLIIRISSEIGEIKTIALDGQLSQESTWSTPFENSNPENRLPSLLGSLQSGVASDTAQTLGFNNVSDALEAAKNRSSFTKINSTQIYVSSQSLSLQFTLLFMAWSNAKEEVEDKLALLHAMATPLKLSDQTLVQSVATSEDISIETFMPSVIPPKLTVHYGGKIYNDMILQSFNRPIVGNMDSDGNLLNAEVTIQLMSYQAWDKSNVDTLYAGG